MNEDGSFCFHVKKRSYERQNVTYVLLVDTIRRLIQKRKGRLPKARDTRNVDFVLNEEARK